MSNRPARRPKQKRERPEPVVFNTADKLKLFGILGAIFLFVAALLNFAALQQQAQGLDKTIMQWKTDYHLSEEQMRQIRVLEESFHGKNPLFRSGHTPKQTAEHHSEIARCMNSEDGARFLKHQIQYASDGGKH